MSGHGSRGAPPVIPTRLLEAALPDDPRGRSILGDVLEEWHERPPGLRRASWYWRTCLLLGASYLRVRRRLPGIPPRRSGRSSEGGGWALLPFGDLRHGLRRALRSPASSALTVLALGIGIAAPTIMVSLLVGVTRDLPVPEPDALVHVGRRYTPGIVRVAPLAWVRPLLDEGWASASGLESVGAFDQGRYDVSGGNGFPERRVGAAVTPGVFRALRVEPSLGRTFDESDAGSAVVVISDVVWRERFGGGADILGRRVRVDGVPHTVVGVMPPRFAFPDDVGLWVPLEAGASDPERSVELVGRLAEGASVETLRLRVATAMEGLREAGTVPADLRASLDATPWGDRALGPGPRRILYVMVLLVSFLLVIACADVAHLFLARALSTRRETAVRVALGAGRWRVARQHLAEAAVLASLGGVVGLLLAGAGVPLLAARMAPRLGWWMEIRLDPVVVLVAAGFVGAAALMTGLVPALHATRVDVGRALRDGGRGASGGRGIARLTGGLVVGEVALCCALLVVAGLLIQGALENLRTDGDFATASVLTAQYSPRPERLGGEDALDFHRRFVERLAAEPAVEALGLAVSHLPGITAPRGRVEVERSVYERPEDRPTTHVVYVSPGFLEALGVDPLRGRDLTWADGGDGPPVALVNEPFARRHLTGRDALGARVRLAPVEREGGAEPAGEWATVVGVVPPLGLETGLDPDDTGIYLPLAASPPERDVFLFLRAGSGTAPESMAPVVREAARELDPDLALDEVASLETRMRANRDMESLFAMLFLFFGVSGLVLAGVGLYGLMVFTVGRRLRELGIRSALGARPAAVVWTAVRGGTVQVGLGLVLGLGLASLLAQPLGTLFMGFSPRDPLAYAVVTGMLLCTGVLAALTPARRALFVDVAEVLRAE